MVEKTPEPSRALKPIATGLGLGALTTRRKDPRALTGAETGFQLRLTGCVARAACRKDPRALTGAETSCLPGFTARAVSVEKTPEPSRALKPKWVHIEVLLYLTCQ